MTNIVHCRIDFRLIHGQVVTKWLKMKEATLIMIIDDELSKDEFLGMVYKMAAPRGYEVLILSIEDALKMRDSIEDKRIFILFKNIETASEAVKHGFRLESLQVGGLEGKPGKTSVFHHFPVDENDCDLLKGIENAGTHVFFQTVPGENEVELSSVLQKMKEKSK